MRTGRRKVKVCDDLGDEPTISKVQARVFFGLGRNRFFEKWKQSLRFEIRHVETPNGVKVALLDTIKWVFPEATNEVVYKLALEYLMRQQDKRCEMRALRKNLDE